MTTLTRGPDQDGRARTLRFRPGSLKKLGAPPELDAPVRLGQPYSVLTLVLLVVLVLSGAVWVRLGSVPRTATAEGILTHTDGNFDLQSPTAGQITGVFISEGFTFPMGTPMFSVQVGDHQVVIRSIVQGRVTAVVGKVGQIIAAGTALANIERINESGDPLVASVYVPGDKVALIRPGDQVTMAVESAPAQDFGRLRGTVESIGQFPKSQQQIADFLGDAHLGSRFSAGGQPWQVIVRLTRADTVSKYRWTTRSGPPFLIDSRTMVSAQFHLAALKPADWLVA